MINDTELSLILAQHEITTTATDDGGERYGCSCGGFDMILSANHFRDRLSAHESRAKSRRVIAAHVAEHFVAADDGAEYVEKKTLCDECGHALYHHDPDYGRCLDPGCHVGREQCRRTADARGSFIPIWQEG